MAKKAPKRKLNRKAKRLIRRSIAALLMVTAIGVAAIPVPDIQAVDESSGAATAQEKRAKVEKQAQEAEEAGTRKRVQYDVSVSGNDSDCLNQELSNGLLNPDIHTTDVQETFKIKQLSNGQWQYNWQFKFYTVYNESITTELGGTINNVTGGIISEYNKEYDEETVELQAINPMEYYTVTVADYESFYGDGGEGRRQFSLTYQDYVNQVSTGAWGSKQSDKEFFEQYFTSEYNEFIRLAALRYDQEVKQAADPSFNITARIPDPLNKTPNNDFTTVESKYKYYCDCTFATGASPIASKGALTLVYALDGNIQQGESSSKFLYLVRLAEGKTAADLVRGQADKDGFVSETQSVRIIGIANNAFRGVTKIEHLLLPAEIAYIGDSAFESSFLQSIELTNVSDIGNMTFKNCSRLTSVVIGNAVNVIGAEAFSGSALTSVTLPYSVRKIGPGAFSYCTGLKTVDMNSMSGGNNVEVEIGKYAFFDCYGLDSVKMENSGITKIGDGVFATVRTGTSSTQGKWDTVVLPPGIEGKVKDGERDLGDWLFDGRTTLKSVTFPSNYGYLDAVEIPENMFRGCINLTEVIFPDYGTGTCGYVTYKPYLFLDVVEPNLVVSGPANDQRGNKASPRKATWDAISAVSDFIPYKYKDQRTGLEYYEVSDGNYLLTANQNGVLTSCTLLETIPRPVGDIDLVIPAYVGNYKITSIDTNCFNDQELRDNIRSITIEDNSVAEIGSETFINLPKLEWVVIGNSVTKIGDSAFEGCTLLENVTFNSPANGDYAGFQIGTNAFRTGSKRLTFHGDIKEGYAPFDWAMDADNYIDKDLGIRVCYKSLSPTNLTVLYDNATGARTLVDYPKYSRIDDDNKAFITRMENTYYERYASSDYDDRRASFLADWMANGAGAYQGDWYGPWVNRTWILTQENTGGWGGEAPKPYFEENPYSILGIYENPGSNEWQSLTPIAEAWINSALKIVVPSGVDSIDAKKYMEDGSNRYNLVTYLGRNDGLRAEDYDMYVLAQTDKDNVDSVPGLFSGYFKDYDDEDSPQEKKYRGNDRIEEIVLESVTYLPDYAFDSCENLKKVTIGPGCENIGTSPFRGCDNLAEVVFQDNDKYTSNKGIIYSVNEDGSYTIEECLPYRGMDTSMPPVINLSNDPDLAKVSAIREGAFEDCNHISAVDLRDSPNLTTIPEKAFKNCKILTQVWLPESVNLIKEEAFAMDLEGEQSRITVTIPGREVHIATDAFEHVPTAMIRSYEDSAAHEYADYHGIGWENLAETFQVIFIDYDGSIIGEVQHVEKDKNAVPPEDPTREGYTFIGWSEDYTGITKDTICLAQYRLNGEGDDPNNPDDPNKPDNPDDPNKPNDPNDPNNPNNPGNSGSDGKSYTVTVVNGSGGGTYLSGSTVQITANTPASGKRFSYWSSADGVSFANANSATTTFTMPTKNVTVTANYTTGSSSGSNNNGNSSVSGNSSNKNDKNNTTVTINRPGFNNTDISSATVNGSKDGFMVRITETAEATQAFEAALTAEYGSLENIRYFPMDITLWDSTGTTKITDTTGITVDITIPLPTDFVTYGGNNKIAGVVNDRLDKLSPKFTTIDGVPCMTFRATHFSPYGIYVDTANLNAGAMQDSTPKTGDGIHPKWFLAIGLASISVVLFLKKDKKGSKAKVRVA